MVDAGSDLGPSPFDDELSDVGDEAEELDEEAPRVVLGTLSDLALGSSSQGTRPVWFVRDEDAELVGLIERYPEGPMPAPLVEKLLTSLRQFAATNALDLQTLLGPTERLHYGFHTSAELDEVVESFEDDGFEVLLGLEDGSVSLPSGSE
jgi:hypothetical protein